MTVEEAMRKMALALLAFAGICALDLAATPALAQTYAPPYPVCLHVYGRVTYYECAYTSLPQCNAAASGRPAQCVVNPYLASAGFNTPRQWRRHNVY
jgi:uncharacterized protein DUF3551